MNNVVLYGVEECGPEADLEVVATLLSSLDRSISAQSISDCFRLGKFSRGSRPRPILIKLIRISDVNKILSKARQIPKPFTLKPDMSHSQRIRESILLKERWRLLQKVVARKSIRIREESLFVNNQLHGRVVNRKFETNPASPFCSTGTPDCEAAPVSAPIVPEQPALSTVDNLSPVHNNESTSSKRNSQHSTQQFRSPPVTQDLDSVQQSESPSVTLVGTEPQVSGRQSNS